MKITVEFAGWLKKYNGGAPAKELDITGSAGISEIAALVGMPEHEVGFVTKKDSKTGKEVLLRGTLEVTEGTLIKLYANIIGG